MDADDAKLMNLAPKTLNWKSMGCPQDIYLWCAARNALPPWEFVDWGWQDILKCYQTEWLKRKTGVQRGEERSSKEKNLEREITIWLLWELGYLSIMSRWAPFKTFVTVIFFLAQYEGCCRQRKLCCHSSLGWEHKKLRLFPLIQTSEFGQLDSTLESEFAALFDHFMQFLLTLERLRDILTTWVHPCLREKSAYISDLDSNPQRTGFHLYSW